MATSALPSAQTSSQSEIQARKRRRRDGAGSGNAAAGVATTLPSVTEQALHHESISREVGNMRMLGVRGGLRRPASEDSAQSADAPLTTLDEAAVLRAMLRSPHSIQIDEEDFPELLKVHGELPRVLPTTAPRRQYRERRGRLKTVVHWGQRKLLLSEIEFLTMHGASCTRVVYAGAAPGTHIPFLASLFPHLSFVLVDPGEFRVESNDRITVRREFFTAELARKLREGEDMPSSKTLFVSDVRTGDPKIHSKEEVESFVAKDMSMQQDWIQALAPHMSMLKFRLPWTSGETRYLDGDIHLPVWGPPTTTETRLITDGRSSRTYDHTLYEEQMFYFNNVTRVRRYKSSMVGCGLCESYDSAAEVRILEAFLATLTPDRRSQLQALLSANCGNASGGIDTNGGGDDPDPLLQALFRRLGPECSVRGAKGRHLLTMLPAGAREKWYRAKVFDVASGKYVDAASEEGQELLCAQHKLAGEAGS
eukprot:TRINITY_DN47617_c0_g1_i1.p1 TRINITY_DN47617_c0_g1~~TRINITY_DN47617_c0_g1_i1.p1  ORF type:complete len:480 (-),score=58.64 TRINITY_DN47617_c0_g1_i1:106-1545(-)